MMKRLTLGVISVLIVVLLSGCLYSGAGDDNAAPGAYTLLVQNAVITYQKLTGVLPIHTSDIDTPLYEKYRIDFQKLLAHKLIGAVPGDAFEQGGYYYYMIVNPEDELDVKLLDLRVSQGVADVQRLVNQYRQDKGELPLGRTYAPGFYVLDFEKLGQKQAQMKSVYSDTYLIYLLHESGNVVVDYAPEIMKAVSADQSIDPEQVADLRALLVEQTPMIPVASYPYRWENGVPVIQE